MYCAHGMSPDYTHHNILIEFVVLVKMFKTLIMECTKNQVFSNNFLLSVGQWFSPCTPVSSTNKTDCHDITEILLKVALNTINQPTNYMRLDLTNM